MWPPGKVIGLVGESGSGKSTVARCIMNIYQPRGRILYRGIDTCDREVFRANRKMLQSVRQIIFQDSDSSLNQRMKVCDIITEPMKIQHRIPPRGSYRAEAAFQMHYVGLDEKYLDRRPFELSGGQRQRVAMGRAIVRNPKVFLMDEPLSNLDAKLRGQMRIEISKLHQRLGTTIIYVTHDQTEAMTMADRIVMMNNGYVQQVGSPEEIYENPANLFVAGFLGSPQINFFGGRYKKGAFVMENGTNVSLSKEQQALLKGKRTRSW